MPMSGFGDLGAQDRELRMPSSITNCRIAEGGIDVIWPPRFISYPVQVDGELRGILRFTFAQIFARFYDIVPRL